VKKTITTWWVNRVATYAIPAPIVFVAMRHAYQANYSGALESLCWAAAIIGFFEIFFLGFKIEIEDGYLHYWPCPRYIRRPLNVSKNSLVRIEQTYFDAGHKLKTASIMIHTSRSNKNSAVLHLASFSPSDVRAVIGWLESAVAKK
jgi:hypothetical protein